MKAAGQTGIDVEFQCTLVWGKDPKISLVGTVTRLSGESLSILIAANTDERLVPAPGRTVRVDIRWFRPDKQMQKQLVCRGAVCHVNSNDVGTLLVCDVRSSRFRDECVKANSAIQANSSNVGWTM